MNLGMFVALRFDFYGFSISYGIMCEYGNSSWDGVIVILCLRGCFFILFLEGDTLSYSLSLACCEHDGFSY